MNLNIYSQEIQNYIREIDARRKQTGSLDYDTCQRILEYAAEAKSDAIFGIGYYSFAEYYWDKQDAEKTMHCLAECANCFRSADLYEYLPRVYNMMGVVSDSKDNRLVALSYYCTCIQYAEVYHDTYVHALADCNIAYILIRMKRYKDVKEHCYSAVEYFEKSEDTVFRKRNIIQCMVFCGFCHLILEEIQEAFDLWDRIQDILRKHPDCIYSKICLLAFEAGCESARGNSERATRLADEVEQEISSAKDLQEIQEIVVMIADYLTEVKNDERVERLIKLMDSKQVEKNGMVYFDLYPFKSKYLLGKNKIEEYIAYTKQYFALYQKHLEDSKEVTARILELQDKLSRVELEQKDIRAYNRKLESIALYDSMTGLANRTYLNEYLSQKFEEACVNQTSFGVELVDIDYFKEYNDTYGHLAGDICIEAVAGILKQVEGENVFCARYGGDEFMIVYSGMTAREIRNVVETIQNRVRELELHHENMECGSKVTVSQGVFVRVPDEENREWDFNSMADMVLYEAKREGRNRYHIATEFISM